MVQKRCGFATGVWRVLRRGGGAGGLNRTNQTNRTYRTYRRQPGAGWAGGCRNGICRGAGRGLSDALGARLGGRRCCPHTIARWGYYYFAASAAGRGGVSRGFCRGWRGGYLRVRGRSRARVSRRFVRVARCRWSVSGTGGICLSGRS